MPDSAEVTEPRWGMWHVTEMTNRQLYDAIDECEHVTRQHLNHGGTAKQRERRRWQCIRAESWLVILRGEQVRRKLVYYAKKAMRP